MASSIKSGAAAGLLLIAVHEGFNSYSALMSSPWTCENFGADPEKAASSRRLVRKATAVNIVLGIGTSMVIGNWTPLLGLSAVSAWMYWEYEQALARGAAAGTTGWAKD